MSSDILLHHSPNLLDGETLEAVFVQRDPLATEIVDRIRESVEGRSKHYVLLVGPRGIGKTHLVSVVHHRIVSQPELGPLKIAWLREEEYGVGSFLDLLIRIFRALATNDPDLAARVEPLYALTPADAEHAAARLLKEYIGQSTILVIVENLDELFDGLGERGQNQLRSYIQENPFWTIVATAQSLFTSVSRRTSPFYGFFDIIHLDEFGTDEIVELISKVATINHDEDLVKFVNTPAGRARIRAVRHIAGGNPRIYVIFADFVSKESLDELVGAFMRMLDELTPYYQHKMKMLTNQQRKIVEYLCDRGGAVPVKEIAQRCFISQQVASAQLGELRKIAYVHASHPGALGREVYYELHEPLMRLCVELKKNRGEPIRLFVDFLRLWYTRGKYREGFELLAEANPEERVATIYTALKHAWSANPQAMSGQIRKIVEAATIANLQTELSVALLLSIKTLTDSDESARTLATWTAMWAKLSHRHPTLELSARLIETLIRYFEDKDPRILLELPFEQRKILEGLLGVESIMDDSIRPIEESRIGATKLAKNGLRST
ncbi:MAG: AAA family ATPase [Capsulimonadaceae bacterium]